MTAEPLIRVLVADDQAIVREGIVTVLSLLPDMEVVGDAEDGEQAIERALVTKPDVVLMDLRMPKLDGAQAARRLSNELPSARVLVLTTYADDEAILGALQAGAFGYLTKDAGRAELAASIRAVASGQATFSPVVGAKLLERAAAAPARASESGREDGDLAVAKHARDAAALRARFPAITARESEVFALVASGRSNPEIASQLFLGVATVKSHINTLFAKLDVRDRPQAIALALLGRQAE